MVFSLYDNIDKLNLSTRANNVFKRNNIHTVEDFMNLPEENFISMRNIGDKTLSEILGVLSMLNKGEYTIVDSLSSANIKNEDIKEFVHIDGNKYVDFNIKDMGFSVRPFNCLTNAGYIWLSEIINLTESDLKYIPNIGAKSISEIITTLESFVLQASPLVKSQNRDSDNICNLIFQNLREFMVVNGVEHYNNIIYICERYVNQHLDTNDFETALTDSELLNELQANDYIKKEYCSYLTEIIKTERYGCTYGIILEKTPFILRKKAFIDNSINSLTAEGKVRLIEDNTYIIILESFVDCLKNILKENEYNVFIKRTQNLTLEQIGIEIGTTRERVRQIESKAIAKINKSQLLFKEDIYLEIFNEYEFTEEEFVRAFKNVQTYYYLISRYSRRKGEKHENKKLLSEALFDARIPEKMKKSIERAVYKNYVKLGSEYMPCKRPEITNYVLKTFATNDISFQDFKELYLTIIEDIGKRKEEKLALMDRGYENRIAASDTVLWKFGKKLRYYNQQGYNFNNLFEVLNLEQYKNIELSTRKFFKLYPETMKEYDIRDEYELHNLLKKLCKNSEINHIKFGRMPNIEFGKIDLNEQVLNLLLSLAPISNVDFAQAYEEEYGVSSATVLANYMGNFDEYFHDGMYKIDATMLPTEVMLKLKKLLDNDFYLIDTIRETYGLEFPYMDNSLINPFSIKSLGFRVYSSYAVSNRFVSATDFFNNLLLEEDIFNLNDIASDIKQLLQFTSQLYRLKSNYDIVEFSPNKYIKFERLYKNGIRKENILIFNKNVFDFVGEGKYFTIHSILEDGFSNELEKYGFEDWFFSSLLAECKNEVSYLRIGGNKLFILGNVRVLFEEFIESVIFNQTSLSMDIYDLKDLLESYYNINVSTYKLIEATKNTSMYYDVISEKIYADYDIYYEEI